MSTLEIPRQEWTGFFKQFNALHIGWRCTMEIFGESIGAQVQSSGLPLTGIDAEVAEQARITVALGGRPDAHLTHVIDEPEHVALKQADRDGDDEVLEIVGHDMRTLLRFQASPGNA